MHANGVCNALLIERIAALERMRKGRRTFDAVVFRQGEKGPAFLVQGRLDVGRVPVLGTGFFGGVVCYESLSVVVTR